MDERREVWVEEQGRSDAEGKEEVRYEIVR